jgi:transcription elongation factor B subunit 2
MDVFLMIRRQKTTIFADAKETTTVYEVKKIIEGILKKSPEDQRLYKIVKDQQIAMDDSKQLSEYGYTHTTARAQLPETIGLVYRTGTNGDKDEFEPLEITPVSTPPDLPDVMKGDSSNSQPNIDSTA